MSATSDEVYLLDTSSHHVALRVARELPRGEHDMTYVHPAFVT